MLSDLCILPSGVPQGGYSSPSLFIIFVKSLLEYGVVVWHLYLTRNELRMERVQNRFLSYTAFLLKIDHPQNNYSLIRFALQLPSLASRWIDADNSFINSFLNGSIDSPDLLSQICFRVPTHNTRNHKIIPYTEC